MRTINLIFALLFALNCKAQVTLITQCDTLKNINGVEEIIHNVVDEMPEFPGGMEALLKFIRWNLNYPIEADITGVVIVKFAVMKDGSVDRVTVHKSVHPLIDKEVVRVVKMLPNWKPGKINGKDVNCYYIIPVNISLQ